jgi:hypothetical protein
MSPAVNKRRQDLQRTMLQPAVPVHSEEGGHKYATGRGREKREGADSAAEI